MNEEPKKILYQSFVEEPNDGVYWKHLTAHLESASGSKSQIDVKGITPQDSYAQALVEWCCGREAICNAVVALGRREDMTFAPNRNPANAASCRT